MLYHCEFYHSFYFNSFEKTSLPNIHKLFAQKNVYSR